MSKTITAIFNKKEVSTQTGAIWKYDYGRILRIEGLELPTAVEIHFSLDEACGRAITRIGTTRENVTEVVIPDTFLETDCTENYMIYAFIYLTDDTSGRTEYKITTVVQARPKPEVYEQPAQKELFAETVNAVNDAADRANASETAAAASASEAAQTKEDIQNIKNDIDHDIAQFGEDYNAAKTDLENKRVSSLKDISDVTSTAASNILSLEQGVLTDIGAAKEDALKGIAEKKTEIEMATETANRVVEQINTADTKLTETMKTADTKKTALDESITNAGKSKTVLDDSKTAADKSKVDLNTSKQAADKSKSDLDASKVAADQSKTNLDASKTAADTSKADLDKSITAANEVNTELKETTDSASGLHQEVVGAAAQAKSAATAAEKASKDANAAIQKVLEANHGLSFSLNEDGTLKITYTES